MKTDKVWGIDLTGRKMWYEPWPVDENGIYRAPSEEEINEIYGIYGEAVSETLLYFEDCGGDTDKLVEMLNDHVIYTKYHISRDELLDASRWYNNEYYFYFIMFTKKVIGRYDFHFGENSDEPLSMYHRPYERGFLKFIPWGNGENGDVIRDINGTFIVASITYTQYIISAKRSEFDVEVVAWLKLILEEMYKESLTIDFLKKEFNWYSLELVFIIIALLLVFSNKNNLIDESPRYYIDNVISPYILFLLKRASVMSRDYILTKQINTTTMAIDYSLLDSTNCSYTIKISYKNVIRDKYKSYVYFRFLNKQIEIMFKEGLIRSNEIIYNTEKVFGEIKAHNDRLNGFSIIDIRWLEKRRGKYKYPALSILFLLLGFLNSSQYSFFIVLLIGTMVIFSLMSLLAAKNDIIERYFQAQKDDVIDFEKGRQHLELIMDELRNEKYSLEIKVQERTRELAVANEKLRDLDRMKTNFFANISHELRTPLTLMLTPVKEALKGTVLDRNDLEIIDRNGSNLLSLINDLLDVSRITAGRMKLKVLKTDAGEMLKHCCAEMESAAKLKGISLNCKLPETPVEIYADKKILQVISNFFSNSFKFTDPGGSIDIKLFGNDSEAILIFSDTGCGIPPDKLDTIFDRFTQADTTSTRRYEGTGIGLSIVNDLVKLHGGTVSVTSRHVKDFPEDHGTVFTVKVPAGKGHFKGRSDVEIPEGVVVTAPYGKSVSGIESVPYGDISMPHVRGLDISGTGIQEDVQADESKPTIFIVEDNRDLRSMLERMLSGRYNVITASDGLKAVKVLDGSRNIDLVLSDIMMPVMDGHELLQRIRSDERYEDLPVIFLTARADTFMKLEGLDLGAIDYITKPFSSDELKLRIKNQMTMKIIRNRLVKVNNRLYEQLQKKLNNDNGSVSGSTERKLEKVVEFIKENYTCEISREGLASVVNLSPDHLSRSFRKYTGKRIDSYINELRIGEAKRQLADTGKTVIRIAFDTGFESISPFNRAFLEIEGQSPTKYREKMRNTGSLQPVL